MAYHEKTPCDPHVTMHQRMLLSAQVCVVVSMWSPCDPHVTPMLLSAQVCVVDKRVVQGRSQEWNISRGEIQV